MSDGTFKMKMLVAIATGILTAIVEKSAIKIYRSFRPLT